MTFEEICLFRDEVLKIRLLKEKLERTYHTVHSQHFNGYRGKRSAPKDTTAEAAINAAMIRNEIEELTRKNNAQLPELERIIQQHTFNDESLDMVKQYFIEGKELWQIKNYADKRSFLTDPIDSIYSFYYRIREQNRTGGEEAV